MIAKKVIDLDGMFDRGFSASPDLQHSAQTPFGWGLDSESSPSCRAPRAGQRRCVAERRERMIAAPPKAIASRAASADGAAPSSPVAGRDTAVTVMG